MSTAISPPVQAASYYTPTPARQMNSSLSLDDVENEELVVHRSTAECTASKSDRKILKKVTKNLLNSIDELGLDVMQGVTLTEWRRNSGKGSSQVVVNNNNYSLPWINWGGSSSYQSPLGKKLSFLWAVLGTTVSVAAAALYYTVDDLIEAYSHHKEIGNVRRIKSHLGGVESKTNVKDKLAKVADKQIALLQKQRNRHIPGLCLSLATLATAGFCANSALQALNACFSWNVIRETEQCTNQFEKTWEELKIDACVGLGLGTLMIAKYAYGRIWGKKTTTQMRNKLTKLYDKVEDLQGRIKLLKGGEISTPTPTRHPIPMQQNSTVNQANRKKSNQSGTLSQQRKA